MTFSKLLNASVLAALFAFVLPQAHARPMGSESGNGGDSVALEFGLAAQTALDDLQSLPNLASPEEVRALNQALSVAKVLTTSENLPVEANNIFQNSVAKNIRASKTIVIHRELWAQITDFRIKKALALHELAGLIGLESTGDYHFSEKYLSSEGVVVAHRFLKQNFLGASPRAEQIIPTPGNFEKLSTRQGQAAIASLNPILKGNDVRCSHLEAPEKTPRVWVGGFEITDRFTAYYRSTSGPRALRFEDVHEFNGGQSTTIITVTLNDAGNDVVDYQMYLFTQYSGPRNVGTIDQPKMANVTGPWEFSASKNCKFGN
jgi:hypothetical protein